VDNGVETSLSQHTSNPSPSKIPHPKVHVLSVRSERSLRDGCPPAHAPDFLSWSFKDRPSVDISVLRPVPECCKQHPFGEKRPLLSLLPSMPLQPASMAYSAIHLTGRSHQALAFWSRVLSPTLGFTSFRLMLHCASIDTVPGQSLTRVMSIDRQHLMCFLDHARTLRSIPLDRSRSDVTISRCPLVVTGPPLPFTADAICCGVGGACATTRLCSAAKSVAGDPSRGVSSPILPGLNPEEGGESSVSIDFFPLEREPVVVETRSEPECTQPLGQATTSGGDSLSCRYTVSGICTRDVVHLRSLSMRPKSHTILLRSSSSFPS
jgi:hypothetical protein